jgi:urease accessory protein
MLAVGVWAAMLGGRAVWAVPSSFVGTMALGFLLAMAGLALPFVEPAILASVVVLGLVVAAAVRLPVAAGALLVGAFALFHGFAHGGEMGAASPAPYLLGFAAATAALHAAGIAIGHALGSGALGDRAARLAARGLGAGAAAMGVLLAFT